MPPTTAAAELPAPRPEAGGAAPELAILLVDDEPRYLAALSQLLRRLPARLVLANSGEEALALAEAQPFAVAIVDVQMPGMDGYELAEALRATTARAPVPVIIVSAMPQDERLRARGYACGAVDYLIKPPEPAVLLTKVGVFLELARVRGELEQLVHLRTRELEAKAALLRRRSAMRRVLAEISRKLARTAPAEVRAGVVQALGQIAADIGASHAFLHLPPDGPDGDSALEWSQGRSQGPDTASSYLPAMAALAPLVQGEGASFQRLAELPLAPEDRGRLQRLGVSSMLLFPVVDAAGVVGVLGFDWRGAVNPARGDLMECLVLLPEILHGALEGAASESRRQESQAQHRILFETMAQGVVYQDAKGAVLLANGAADRILGLSSTDRSGRDAADPRWQPLREDGSPLPPEELPVAVALRTGRAVHGVVMGVYSPRDAGHRWILVDAVPFTRPGEAAPDEVYTTFSDITDLRRATAEKERLAHVEAESRAKSTFLASMSHEIRTPMNAMLGYTQLLLREQGLTARQHEYLETIDRSGAHLLTLVNNVLDVARIESGVEPLVLAPTDLRGLLRDVERMFRLRAADKGLTLRMAAAPSLPERALADGGKVRQVLINLVGNALKFTPSGTISVSASASMPVEGRVMVRFEVEDSGVGIAPAHLDTIFSPFVQVAPGAARSGTGLGLSVSRRFARLMGGEVTARSTLGQGSSFRFVFEAEATTARAEGEDAPRVVGLAEDSPRVRVLLVEDDADNRLMLARMLDAGGLEVREATCVEGGVAAFAREPASIVLTDLRLPDGSGLEVLRRVRALPGGAGVPVVVVSASALLQERDAAIAAGVDGFVGKPIREATLFAEVARLTGARFRHADDPPPAPRQVLPSPEALGAVAPARRSALLAALVGGYVDEIGVQVAALERETPAAVAGVVRDLADRFEYARLIRALEDARGAP